MLIDIKNKKIDKNINILINDNCNLQNELCKEIFFFLYGLITIILYLIPFFNTIILILHLIFNYIESKEKSI